MLFHGSDRRKSSCGFSYAPIKNGQTPLIFYAFPYCIPPRLFPDSFCMHGRQKSVKELFFTFTVPQSFFVSIIRPCFVLPLPAYFFHALSFFLSYALFFFSFFSFPAFPRAVPIFFFSFFARVLPSPYIYFFLTPSQTFPCLVYVSPSLPLLLFRFSPRPPALCILFSLLLLGYTLSFPFPLPLSPRLPLLFSAIRKALQKRFALQGQKKDSFVCARKLASIFIRFYNVDSVFTALIFRGGNFQKLRYPPKDAAVPLLLANGSST